MPALAPRNDPSRLSARVMFAVLASAGRELRWGLRAVRDEVALWRGRAESIADGDARAEALAALAAKRPLLDGAALFWILPRHRSPELLRLLVVVQMLANFHDRAGERAVLVGGQRLAGSAATLADVLADDGPLPPSYGAPGGGDDGYLHALATACRTRSAAIVRSPSVREVVVREARCAQTMDFEHAADQSRLRAFVHRELGTHPDLAWWELASAASSLLPAIVALALAVDETNTIGDIERAVAAYRWVGAIGTLLDHYIDHAEDTAVGEHNYLNYYADRDVALRRLSVMIDTALREVRALRRGERHQIIVASMAAMYLTSDSARAPALRATTHSLTASGGSLTRLLLPLLLAWRLAYREGGA